MGVVACATAPESGRVPIIGASTKDLILQLNQFAKIPLLQTDHVFVMHL